MNKLNAYINLPYEQGISDCYTRVMEFYRNEYEQELRNYARPENWAYVGLNFFEDKFAAEGFQALNVCPNNVRYGDLLLMNLQRSPVANHIAIYVGQNKILHHLKDKLSSIDDYTYRWQSRVTRVLRHPVVEAHVQLPGLSSLIERLPAHLRIRVSRHDD